MPGTHQSVPSLMASTSSSTPSTSSSTRSGQPISVASRVGDVLLGRSTAIPRPPITHDGRTMTGRPSASTACAKARRVLRQPPARPFQAQLVEQLREPLAILGVSIASAVSPAIGTSA